MKTKIDEIIQKFLEGKNVSPQHADLVVAALKQEGLSTEELFSFIDTLTPDYEREMFGEFTGRVHNACDALDNAVSRIIEWENLSIKEILAIVEMTGVSRHRYNDDTARAAVKTGKLSVDDMITMLDSGKLNNHCNGTLISMIRTEKFSKEQVLRIVKASSHQFYVTVVGVETKLFSIEEMLDLWEKSFRDHAVAVAISKTGLASEEDKKTLAGSNAGLLRELMGVKS